MAKPAPKSIKIVCTICDLPWEAHTKDRKTAPTADVCIRLLKAELAKRPRQVWNGVTGYSGSASFVPNFSNNSATN